MRLTEKQIIHIKQEVVLDDQQKIVRINVSNYKKGWSLNERLYNIYRVDRHFNIIWQVTEPHSEPWPIPGGDSFYCLNKEQKGENLYGYIVQQAAGEIIGDRFSGLVYVIDPDTGVATNVALNPR